MRKPLISFCLSCLCSVASGQGLVNFFNSQATLVSGVNGAPTTPAGSYYFALLTAPVGTTDPRLFTFTGCYATNQAAPGRFNGGVFVAVPGWPAGTERAFLVCGWPAYAGHDWNPNRFQGPFGMSMIAFGTAGGIGTGSFPVPPLNLFGSTTISSGFMITSGCLGPYWMGFTRWPTNQTIVLGASARI